MLPVLIVGEGSDTAAAHDALTAGGYLAQLVSVDSVEDALTSRFWSLVLVGGSSQGLDAVAMCKQVRASHSQTPIVALTSSGAGQEPGAVLEAGATDFVVTPFEPVELLTRVAAATFRRSAGAAVRLAALIANIPGTVYRCDVDESWTMRFISDRIEDLCGYAAADFIGNAGRTFASIIHPDDRERVQSTVTEAVHRDRPFEVGYRVIASDGGVRHVVDRGRLVHDEDGHTWLDGVLVDVTNERSTEEKLREQLAMQIATEERLRIARDLHDSVSQTLYAMVTHARAAELALDQGDNGRPGTQESVVRVRELAQLSLVDMRSMLTELRPDLSLTHDLVSGVRRHAEDVATGNGIPVVVDATLDESTLPADTAAGLYWVVREAVHNAAKHARPSAITITLSNSAVDEVEVVVSDDGVGFDPTDVAPGHFGLVTMRERMTSMSGRLDVLSSPGHGTSVRAVAPAPTPHRSGA